MASNERDTARAIVRNARRLWPGHPKSQVLVYTYRNRPYLRYLYSLDGLWLFHVLGRNRRRLPCEVFLAIEPEGNPGRSLLLYRCGDPPPQWRKPQPNVPASELVEPARRYFQTMQSRYATSHAPGALRERLAREAGKNTPPEGGLWPFLMPVRD